MTKTYKWWNNTMGWLCFAFSLTVYLLTIEPTVSWWDCGEFIAAAHKLEVGHSPGAPLFLLVARLFSMFASPTEVAFSINILSALCSASTVLFLFWTITALVKKMAVSQFKAVHTKQATTIAILGSGVVGALAFAFSDSFWFSAVEAEVYAMSSLFTALVFWAILKWETVADEPAANRWIVLIAYLTGLSIGVHLLNLLAIPAIAFVYYFKKYRFSYKGFFLTAFISICMLGFLFKGIIPGVVQLASHFELLFINTLGFPFYSGIIVYFIFLTILLILLLHFAIKKHKAKLHLITICVIYIIIGYSTYAMIMIRSNANPPLDEGNPENVFSLLSYLNREQYGASPLLFGNYYNTPLDKNEPYLDGNPMYTRGKEKYEIIDDKKGSVVHYDIEQSTFFPRMWSADKKHIDGYKQWAGTKGDKKPSMSENLNYFFSYQLNFMYWRYFMWNFAGRQNDIQGHGGILNGNWLSGISLIDSIRLGNQPDLPDSMKENKGYNRFFLLPLILGLIGLIYHYKKDKAKAFIIFLLFFFTGIAIVFFLNQTTSQPRERDYAYVGSFYAFSIWIGIGVWALFSLLSTKLKSILSSILVISTCMVAAPALMLKEGYDDHNRSGKYIAHDFAYNILISCEPNAILFTNGDNDTFPLWYIQEVEGVRKDVRIICGALLQGDWYIQQMRTKINESTPLSFSVSNQKYLQGYYPVKSLTDEAVDVKEIVRFVNSNNAETKLMAQSGKSIAFIPAKNIQIPSTEQDVKIDVHIKKNYLLADELFILDILSQNDWKRPIYFVTPQYITSLLNIESYLKQEGLVYHLVSEKNVNSEKGIKIDTQKMTENFLTKYSWKSFDNHEQYIDTESTRMCATFRFYFGNLAHALIDEGNNATAEKVLDTCVNTFKEENTPYNYAMINIAHGYYRIDKPEKANSIVDTLTESYSSDLAYYKKLSSENKKSIDEEIRIATSVLQQLTTLSKEFKRDDPHL